MRNLRQLQEKVVSYPYPFVTTVSPLSSVLSNDLSSSATSVSSSSPSSSSSFFSSGYDNVDYVTSVITLDAPGNRKFVLFANGYLLGINNDDQILWFLNVSPLSSSSSSSAATTEEESSTTSGSPKNSNNHGWFHATYLSELDAVFIASYDGTMGLVYVNKANTYRNLSSSSSIAAETNTRSITSSSFSPSSSSSPSSLSSYHLANKVYQNYSIPMDRLMNDNIIELLGSMDGGICQAVWTVDQSRLFVCTGTYSLVLLTPTWDVLAEITVDPYDTKFLSTYITPTEGQSFSSTSSSSSIPIPTVSSSTVYATWRPDGTLLTFSCIDTKTNQRIIRLYNGTDLSLRNITRNEDNSLVTHLHGPIGWSTANALFASAQRIPLRQRTQISFFEANGQRHRELILSGHTHTSVTVTGISWNTQGDILMVRLLHHASSVVPNGGTAVIEKSSIQLWHRDNYHWFLKQEWVLECIDDINNKESSKSLSLHSRRLGDILWDPEQPYRLHYYEIIGKQCILFHSVDLSWEYTLSTASLANTLSVNGENGYLRCTPLGLSQVPSPLSYSTLQLWEESSSSSSSSFSSFLSSTATTTGTTTQSSIVPSSQIPTNLVPINLQNTVWITNGSTVYSERTFLPSSNLDNVVLITNTGNLVLLPLMFLPPNQAQREFLPDNGPLYRIQSTIVPSSSSPLTTIYLRCGKNEDTGEVRLYALPTSSTTMVPSKQYPVRMQPYIQRIHGLPITDNHNRNYTLLPVYLRHIVSVLNIHTIHESSLSTVPVVPSSSDSSGFVTLPAVNIHILGVTNVLGDSEGCVDPRTIGADTFLDLYLPSLNESDRFSCNFAYTFPKGVRIHTVTPVREASIDYRTTLPTDSNDMTIALVHTSDGKVYSFTPGQPLELLYHFPEPCTTLVAVRVPSSYWSSSDSFFTGSGNPASNIPRILVAGIGHRTYRLFINGHHIPSPAACSAIAWQQEYAFLIYVDTVGPIPALNFIPLIHLLEYAMGNYATSTFTASMIGQPNYSVLVPYAGAVLQPSTVVGRALERGSRLISFVPEADAIIVQALRGNIETVVPRTLTLEHIRRLLDQRPFPSMGKAVELMRTHRVDLNLLYDHNPSAFEYAAWLRNAVDQVAQSSIQTAIGTMAVKKATSLYGSDRWDIFLTALHDTDVTTGTVPRYTENGERIIDDAERNNDYTNAKYPRPSWYTVTPPVPLPSHLTSDKSTNGSTATVNAWLPGENEYRLLQSSHKVNRICAHLRSALLYTMSKVHPDIVSNTGVSEPTKEQIMWQHPLSKSVITSYARQSPADLEGLLRAVQMVANAEQKYQQDVRYKLPSTYLTITGDMALNHAIVVCDGDVELLYSAALGCYDVRLAHAIATHGQSDPKEYIPFLASLTRLIAPRSTDREVRVSMNDNGTVYLVQENGILLNEGTVRQRWAIDVHLGRWSRALSWSIILTELQLQSSTVPLPIPSNTEDNIRTTWLQTLLPEDTETIVTQGIQSTLPICLSLMFTHVLYDTFLSLVITNNQYTFHKDWNDIRYQVQLMHGWSIATGNVKITKYMIANSNGTNVSNNDPYTSFLHSWLQRICPRSFVNLIQTMEIKEEDYNDHHNAKSYVSGGHLSSGGSSRIKDIHQALQNFLSLHPPALEQAAVLSALFAPYSSYNNGQSNDTTLAPRLSVSLPENGSAATVSTIQLPPCRIQLQRKRINDSSRLLAQETIFYLQQIPSTVPMETPTALPTTVVPVLRDIVRAMVKSSMFVMGSIQCQLTGARILLQYGDILDTEDGIVQLCACNEWEEAIEWATKRSRTDLVQTVILPSFRNACTTAETELLERKDGIIDIIQKLSTCRTIRSGLPLQDILGMLELEEAVARGDPGAAMEYATGQKRVPKYATNDPTNNDNHSVLSDASSVMSSASSYVSQHSHLFRQTLGAQLNPNTSGRSVISAALSSLSSMSTRTAGVFSHFSMHGVNQALVDSRSSLRLEGSDGNMATKRTMESDDVHRRQTEKAIKALTRHDRRRPTKKKMKYRPGSGAEEEGLETELRQLLPLQLIENKLLKENTNNNVFLSTTEYQLASWYIHYLYLVDTAAILNEGTLSTRLQESIRVFLQEISRLELPLSRRNVIHEIGEAWKMEHEIIEDVPVPYPPNTVFTDPTLILPYLSFLQSYVKE